MKSQGDFRLGIIGCGRISQAYAQAIQNSMGVVPAGVVDVRKEAADALAECLGTPSYYHLEEYLEESGAHGAIVCTPPTTHKQICCKLFEADQHVLCEKPLSISIDSARTMMETARERNCKLMMASKFRYVGDVVKAKGFITSGLLGSIVHFENCFSTKVDMAERWNSDPSIGGGGVLIDNGTHSVDVVRYLIGPIKSVKTRDISVAGLSVEDSVELAFVADGNIKGTITLSWEFPFDRNAYIGLYGTEGRLRINWDLSSYQLWDKPEWIPYGYGYDKTDAFARQIHNFIACVQGRSDPLISDTECLASVAVIETAYRSLKSGRWEDVPEEYTV